MNISFPVGLSIATAAAAAAARAEAVSILAAISASNWFCRCEHWM